MAIVDLSLQQKVGLPCLALGIILFCVAFSVNTWTTATFNDNDVDMGLWKICGSGHCYTWTSDAADQSQLQRGWLHKTQALECIALLLLIGAFGAVIVSLITKMKVAVFASIACCFLSAAFAIIACAVYASDFHSDNVYSAYGHLNWGFGFNIVAGVFTAAAGVGFLLHAIFATTVSNSPS